MLLMLRGNNSPDELNAHGPHLRAELLFAAGFSEHDTCIGLFSKLPVRKASS